MEGYEDEIIMAGGTFVEGATIELSCDGPIREPYIAYMQGGLTYEYGKIGVLKALCHLGRPFLTHFCAIWDSLFLHFINFLKP